MRMSAPADRAPAFVDEVLIPREVAAERDGGRLPDSEVELIRREAQIEHYLKRFSGVERDDDAVIGGVGRRGEHPGRASH
jgi:hypothetical protein